MQGSRQLRWIYGLFGMPDTLLIPLLACVGLLSPPLASLRLLSLEGLSNCTVAVGAPLRLIIGIFATDISIRDDQALTHTPTPLDAASGISRDWPVLVISGRAYKVPAGHGLLVKLMICRVNW